MPGKILIVDDEKDMLTLLSRIIREETSHEVQTESDPFRALETFRSDHFDLVLSDLKMPKMDGIQLLESLLQADPDVSVILLTAYGTIESAVDATRKGAYEYITKPFRRERILLTIDKAMQWQAIVRENRRLKEALFEKEGLASMVGAAPAIQKVFDRIRQVAPTMATILITGASGTGKELVARAIHQMGNQRKKNLVTINCTAIPEEVLESELFGHVKGAFTGAWKDKRGLVEEAHEGTLFLDEIGDLSPRMQTKLLRLIQEGEFKPVGSNVTRKADIRFLAATNHNLKSDILDKRFREDLYYRLNVIHFELPELKDRRKDIPLLAYHFLKKYSARYDKQINSIRPDVLHTLENLDYPGNVRELENLMERGVIFCQGDTLCPAHLVLETEPAMVILEAEKDIFQLNFKDSKERMIQNFHRQYIHSLLQESNGNISRAAEKAGIQRQYLHRLIKEAGIETDLYKEGNEL